MLISLLLDLLYGAKTWLAKSAVRKTSGEAGSCGGYYVDYADVCKVLADVEYQS